MATKEDTTKRFAQISKKIRELFEMNDRQPQTQDDGMFTKKHLSPATCAACEKNLVGISGMPAEHTNWKKFPFKENNERIARYAQGFSKMLSTMHPEQINMSSHSQLNHHERQSPFASNAALLNNGGPGQHSHLELNKNQIE